MLDTTVNEQGNTSSYDLLTYSLKLASAQIEELYSH